MKRAIRPARTIPPGGSAAVWGIPKAAGKGAGPFDPAHSWLFRDARPLAILLAILAAVLYVIAAAGLVAHADWWRPIAVAASGAFVVLMTVFFNPWLIAGWRLSARLIAGILWFEWPSESMVGA